MYGEFAYEVVMEKIVNPFYHHGFIKREEAEAQFNRLWNELDWVQMGSTPRREYWSNKYDLPYTYGSGEFARTYLAQPWDDFIKATMEQINKELSIEMDCCFVNGYEHQRQHLGWHADDSPEMNPAQPVVIISLGAEREIWFRRKDDHKNIHKVVLTHGSMFVMPAGMQQTHDHRIPKAGHVVGPRVSLTYRSLIPENVAA